jgi:hypothetical protein
MYNIGLNTCIYVCMYLNVKFCMRMHLSVTIFAKDKSAMRICPDRCIKMFSGFKSRRTIFCRYLARRPLPPRRIGSKRSALYSIGDGICAAGGVCSESVCFHTSRDILAQDKQTTIFILENRFQLWDEATAKP